MNKEKLNHSLSELIKLVETLRGPNGCPWDAKQTKDTIKMYLLEEAYEVADAIEEGSSQETCGELGDLLFQIIFLASMAEDRGDYDLIQVMEDITKKMTHRHPHVFGNTSAETPEEVSENWAKIKKTENNNNKTSVSRMLNEIPINLPALLRAHRLSQRASKIGFDWDGKDEVWTKVREEITELEQSLSSCETEKIGEEIGDLMFSLVNLARHWRLNAENLMRDANQKFLKRFREMEEELKSSGIDLDDATAIEMNRVWDKIKS
ncbi:nucleoside triphosphate pyrophosphohydrolase [Thermodesulfobacteriota bacterium]